jgi:choline dehydrogenase-like flavoprotein
MTGTLVKRVIVKQNSGRRVATAVELASGVVLTARKEIIISAGAYRTPQVLMLSGIGDSADLKKHGIEQVVDLPEVGKNLHDHLGIPQRLASNLHSCSTKLTFQVETPTPRKGVFTRLTTV